MLRHRHIGNRHIGILIIGISVLVACSPIYHLKYAVINDTDRPIYCVDLNKAPGGVVRIEPDSFVQIFDEAGIGRARRQFNESKSEVSHRFMFYSDSTFADSSIITPGKGWKYYRLPIDDYNARVYIRQNDLAKK